MGSHNFTLAVCVSYKGVAAYDQKQLLLLCSPEIYETGVLSVIIQQNASFFLSYLYFNWCTCHVEKSRPAKS
jgi:hypothetical protein